MRNIVCTLFLMGIGITAQAQITCSFMSMSVNVSDTGYVKLYHPGAYLLWPREHTIIYWEVQDFQGGIVHRDTTIGNTAGDMGFNHSIPFSDSMTVYSLIINDSVSDGVNTWAMACSVTDTLYWKPDTIGSFIQYRWDFVGGPNEGKNVLSQRDEPLHEHGIRIYPNPASKTISIDGLSEPLRSVSMYTIHGQRVYFDRPVLGNNTVNIDHLPEGHYVLWINERIQTLVQVTP